MENIIYFYEYRGKESQNIKPEKVHFHGQREDYCLIKVGIPLSFWSEEKKEALEAEAPKAGKKRKKKGWTKFFRGLKRTDSKVLKQDSDKMHSPGKEPDKAKKLYQAVLSAADEEIFLREDCRIVYEKNVRPRIMALPDRSRYFSWEEFKDYRDLFWVEQIMPYAVHADYQIVGYAPCILQLLIRHARRIRSVCWILSQAVYTGQVQEFVEDYYEEYGLAITIHLCEPADSLRKASVFSEKKVNVLDFSGEERMPCVSVKQGSVWLDMDAMEEKARRIAVQNPQISYISLRKKWQNAVNTSENAFNRLDTASKSRYNT